VRIVLPPSLRTWSRFSAALVAMTLASESSLAAWEPTIGIVSSPFAAILPAQALSAPSIQSLTAITDEGQRDKAAFQRKEAAAIAGLFPARRVKEASDHAVDRLREAIAVGRYDRELAAGERGVLESYAAILNLPILQALPERHGQSRKLVQQVIAEFPPVEWFMAIVEGSYHYILGLPPARLALDLIVFLQTLERDGIVRSSEGRTLVELRDERGRPYAHLTTEYMLHEKLERTPLSHDEIIALTTKVLGRGVYYPRSNTADFPTGDGPVFRRPGETPLGRALRAFIRWRLRRRIISQIGRAGIISYFDDTYDEVHAMCGLITALQDAAGSNPSIVLREGAYELIVPLDRIVSLDWRAPEILGSHRGSFNPQEPLDLDGIVTRMIHEVDRKRYGPVSISEPQLRTLRAGSRNTLLAEALRRLLALRDREGQRLRSGQRFTRDTGWEILEEAVAIASRLVEIDILLVFDNAAFLGFHTGQPWYGLLPTDYNKIPRLMAEQCAYAAITFSSVSLYWDRGGAQRSTERSRDALTVLVPPKASQSGNYHCILLPQKLRTSA
jgi:hypothetical protein